MAPYPSLHSLLFANLLPLLSIAHRWHPRTSSLDFGTCPNPGITYDYDLDASQQYGFAPTNQTQFPHGFSPDISTLEVYICNTLQWACAAPPPTIQACHSAFELYSGLSGQNAADAWNEALGLYGSTPPSATASTYVEYGTTTTAVATVLVSGTRVPYSTLFSAVSTLSTESLSSSLVSAPAPPTYTVYSTATISRDPTATRTVQSSASPSATLTSTLGFPAALSSSSVQTGTSIIVPTGGATVTTTTMSSSAATPVPQSTGTGSGSGDGGGSPFSAATVSRPVSGLVIAWLVVPAILMLFA